MNIGYFISSHGFGHAARACAIIEKISHDHKIFIFSRTPDWFFNNSLDIEYNLIPVDSDIGLVQNSPFDENLEETLKELGKFLPFKKETINHISELVESNFIDLFFCDISPLGVAVADHLGIPSILIENFTWDWIYEQYLPTFPQFDKFINLIEDVYHKVCIRFSVEPHCQDVKGAIKISPLFREPKNKRDLIRKKLGINEEQKLVLVTMGGIPINDIDTSLITNRNNFIFLFPINGILEQYQQGQFIFLKIKI